MERRVWLAERLEECSIFALRNRGLTESFTSGAIDYPLDELEMDSLAEMELCIAIEVGTGVSLVPEDLRAYGTVGRLAAALEERL